jgi:hypothetical protein
MMFRAGPDSPKPKRRLDAKPAPWNRLRDDLHELALAHGPTWLELSRRSDLCPKGIDGRNYELWQPLLALAAWVESHGEAGLLCLVQRHALASISAARDDQIPDADETLLEILTAKIRADRSPTPGEILSEAQERDLTTFAKWGPRTVSNRLKIYGIEARKIDRRREYRDTTLADLARIQQHYAIDLGISEQTDPPASSRIVPNRPGNPDSGPKTQGFGFSGDAPGRTGRNGTQGRCVPNGTFGLSIKCPVRGN